MSQTLSIVVNGAEVTADIDDCTLLVDFLRDHLRLTGTHVGCDTSQCGACVVLVDGRTVKSCTMLALQAYGAAVTTIEGLAPAGRLHPIQEAFRDNHALQCGFCTPGMVLAAVELAETDPEADDSAIRKGLEGNLCRCTGYHNIVRAVRAGMRAMKS